MKKLISLIGLVLICQCALAQSFSQNLQKYWWYRYRLVNDFMKVGLGFGESIPVTKRHYAPTGDLVEASHLHYGDATEKLGNYMVLLSSEYKILNLSNINTNRTVYELYCAINAFNRLDYYTETHCNNYLLTINNTNLTPVSGDLNGFFMRDDIAPDFEANNHMHFNRTGLCKSVNGLIADMSSRTDNLINDPNHGHPAPTTWVESYGDTPRYPTEESIDQVSDMFKGLASIIYLVPSGTLYNGEDINSMAREALVRMIYYIAVVNSGNNPVDSWKIKNPLTSHCVYGTDPDSYPNCNLGVLSGGNARLIARGWGGGLLQMPGVWSVGQQDKIEEINNLVINPPGLLLNWQYSKTWWWLSCNGDGNLFNASTAAISNNWLSPLGVNKTRPCIIKQSAQCDLRFPQLPLLYRVLHGGIKFKPENFPYYIESYKDRLNSAPQCGEYNYGNGNYGSWNWSGEDYVVKPADRGTSNNAEFPGIDYMTIFNLYILNEGEYVEFYNNPYYRENLQQTYPYTASGVIHGNAANPSNLNYLEYLSTSSHITSTGVVTYRGAKQIELLPGFQADAGSIFLAYIKDYKCCVGEPGDPFPGSGEKASDPNDPFVMDTTEDIVAYEPYPIPEQTDSNYDYTPAEATADSIDLVQQILQSGDTEVINALNYMLNGGVSPTENQRNRYGAENSSVIFPNPNTGSFTINMQPSRPCTVQVLNLYGQQVYTNSFSSSNNISISMPGMSTGVYLLRIVYAGGKYEQKIIIQ